MADETGHEGVGLNASIGNAPIAFRAIDWPNIALLAAALSGIWVAHGVAVWSSEPSTQVVTWTTTLVFGSLAALGVAVAKLVSSAQSRERHVFCGRRVLALGGFFVTMATVLVGSIVRLDPFQQLAARGDVTVEAIVGVGSIGAVMVCMVGAGIALVEAWDICHDERHWGESLGVHRP